MRPVTLEAYPEAAHLVESPQDAPAHGTPYARERFGKEKGGAGGGGGGAAKAGGAAVAGGGGGGGGGAAGAAGGAGASAASASAAAAAAASLVAQGGESVVPGYMPLRGDFDVEHDNEAELLLADMEILPTDDPAEKQLKLMVIDVFNRCVPKCLPACLACLACLPACLVWEGEGRGVRML